MHQTMRDARSFVCFLWKIALMRNADDLVHELEHSSDLSRSGQERNNAPHSATLVAHAPPEQHRDSLYSDVILKQVSACAVETRPGVPEKLLRCRRRFLSWPTLGRHTARRSQNRRLQRKPQRACRSCPRLATA